MNNRGVTSFEIINNRLIYSVGQSGQLEYIDLTELAAPHFRTVVPSEEGHNHTDPKICPGNSDVMAFFRDRDLWPGINYSDAYRLFSRQIIKTCYTVDVIQ